MTTADALTEAYHAIYDVKDAYAGASIGTMSERYLAYETLQKLEALMRTIGVPVPRRFDGDGRPS